MAGRRLRLHQRIVIPFALIAVAAIAATAYVALSVSTRALQTRVDTQIASAAALVSQSDFALNPTILRSVKAIADADVVTFDRSGRVMASTFDAEHGSAMAAAVLRAAQREQIGADDASILRTVECGQPCDVAFRAVVSRPDAIVAIVSTRSDLQMATRAVTRTILVAAVVSLIGMLIAGQIVAKRIAAPVDEALIRSEKLGLAGMFATRVAHDIRNPLSAIKMQTQLVRSRLGSGQDRQSVAMLEAIHRDVLQVESVVQDLLELARPGDVRTAATALGTVIDDAIDHVAPQLTYRKVRIEKHVDPSLPPVMLDAPRFKQALLNVINNASDAMPAGGLLTVSARRDGGEARLDVCDDGVGVDPALLPRVFDPFVSSKGDGVGLGLVNTKSVVENHGGRIEIAPNVPRGTRVSIWLPLGTPQHG